jgi:hypothetical protein
MFLIPDGGTLYVATMLAHRLNGANHALIRSILLTVLATTLCGSPAKSCCFSRNGRFRSWCGSVGRSNVSPDQPEVMKLR